MDIKELINTEIVVAHEGDTVQRACNLMADHNKGFLPVLNNTIERKVVGVISNKDIINKVVATGQDSQKLVVSDIMAKEPVVVSSEASTSDAMFLMRKHNIKRVLVVDNGVLQGIISSNDILDGMLKYKKQLLDMAMDF